MSRKLSDNPELRASRANRRGELRQRAAGTGWMELLDSIGRIEFKLADTSPSGFCACHHYGALSAGQRVRFHHEQAEGVAVVIWNRHFGDDVKSGLRIVSGCK
jgi:hypothetical protein